MVRTPNRAWALTAAVALAVPLGGCVESFSEPLPPSVTSLPISETGAYRFGISDALTPPDVGQWTLVTWPEQEPVAATVSMGSYEYFHGDAVMQIQPDESLEPGWYGVLYDGDLRPDVAYNGSYLATGQWLWRYPVGLPVELESLRVRDTAVRLIFAGVVQRPPSLDAIELGEPGQPPCATVFDDAFSRLVSYVCPESIVPPRHMQITIGEGVVDRLGIPLEVGTIEIDLTSEIFNFERRQPPPIDASLCVDAPFNVYHYRPSDCV